MKIPYPLFEAMPEALFEVFHDGRPVDRVVEYHFKNHRQWGSRDRRLFAETIFEIVRYIRKFWKLSGNSGDPTVSRENLQKKQFERVIASYFKEHFPEVKTPFSAGETQAAISWTRAEKNSYSDWFYHLGYQELGESWDQIASALNQVSDVYLRVNTLKSDVQSVISALEALGIKCEKVPNSETGIRLLERKNLFQTEPYKKGWFEIQDISSQKVAELLKPHPGERVIDACAGAGGKSLHIATLMHNKGRLVSLDINARKLEELKLRARRNGISVIETRPIESTKVIKRLESAADALLLDVPCSGSGVIKRNPDTKYRLNLENWNELLKTQQEILKTYSKMVRAGGRLVYATCSIFPSENEKQLDIFLKAHPEWKLESKKTLIPGRDEGDGFFMALLTRA